MMVEDNNSGPKRTRLNFTRIYKVNFNERNIEAIHQLTEEFNNLPQFTEGDRNNNGKGFIPFEDDFDIKFELKPVYDEDEGPDNWFFRDISISNNSLMAKRFRYEEYFEGKNEPQLREADVFWIKPFDILLMKGSEQACKKIYPYLAEFTSTGFKKIKFDDKFLLWLSYKYEDDGKLSNDLTFNRMDKSRTQGTNTNENDIQVREGEGRMIPVPTLYGLLNKQNLAHIGGDFKYKDIITINAKLAADVTIFVYSSNNLSGKEYSEKCELVFPFIIEIIDVFNKWDSRDSDNNKFPPDEFFNSSIESFRIQMEYAIESIEELKEKYRDLREGTGVEDAP
jgi:hypothetical protein